VLDSLVSPSSYKPAWELSTALDYLRQGAGTHFDPMLVSVLLSHRAEVEHIYQS